MENIIHIFKNMKSNSGYLFNIVFILFANGKGYLINLFDFNEEVLFFIVLGFLDLNKGNIKLRNFYLINKSKINIFEIFK